MVWSVWEVFPTYVSRLSSDAHLALLLPGCGPEENLIQHGMSCIDSVEIELSFDYNWGMASDQVQTGVTLLHDGL
jgi:hypothetical protein